MKILEVCRGSAQTLPGSRTKTGIDKQAMTGPVLIDELGVVGDKICNRKHHGGVDQAIYIEGRLTLDWWEQELGRNLPPGFFGENLVIDALDNRILSAGDRIIAGDVVLEIASARIPCATFARQMDDPGFVARYRAAGRPGAYARVLRGGYVEQGQSVSVQPYAGERIPIPEMMEAFGKRLSGAERERYLAAPIGIRVRDLLTRP